MKLTKKQKNKKINRREKLIWNFLKLGAYNKKRHK